MQTLVLHSEDTDCTSGSRTIQDLVVGLAKTENAFRGGVGGTVINVLGCGKHLTDISKLVGQMWQGDPGGKRFGIAE